MNPWAAVATFPTLKAFSNAWGAKALVFGVRRSAITEAWRASTDTIFPATRRLFTSVRYYAAPL